MARVWRFRALESAGGGTGLRPRPEQSRRPNHFMSEITVAWPEYPHRELGFRYIQPSGIFAACNGVCKGENSFARRLHYRF